MSVATFSCLTTSAPSNSKHASVSFAVVSDLEMDSLPFRAHPFSPLASSCVSVLTLTSSSLRSNPPCSPGGPRLQFRQPQLPPRALLPREPRGVQPSHPVGCRPAGGCPHHPPGEPTPHRVLGSRPQRNVRNHGPGRSRRLRGVFGCFRGLAILAIGSSWRHPHILFFLGNRVHGAFFAPSLSCLGSSAVATCCRKTFTFRVILHWHFCEGCLLFGGIVISVLFQSSLVLAPILDAA